MGSECLKNNIYVDRINGDDKNAGGKETPVKTLKRAQQLVRNVNKDMAEDIIVNIHGGVYCQHEPLVFTNEDSGTNGYSVIWTACPGHTPVISGGVRIKEWELHDEEKNIWKASACGLISRDFFVGGKRAERARRAGKLNGMSFTERGVFTTDKIGALKNADSLEVVLKNCWNQPRLTASAVEESEEGTFIVMKQPGWYTYLDTASLGGAPASPEQVDYIENAYEFLDGPGQWFLDEKADTVYYIPRTGENINTVPAYLGKLEHIVELNGEPGKPVKNIVFKGLTFSYSTWLQASSDAGLLTVQANFYKRRGTTAKTRWDERNWVQPIAAVDGSFTENVKFTDNSFVNIGSGALSLGRATVNCEINGNYFNDCAATAIAVGGYKAIDRHPERSDGMSVYSSGNLICDNTIENAGSVYAAGCGIVVGYVKDTIVEYNTISNLPYTGISFGWGWAWGGAELQNNLTGNIVRNNYLENLMNYLFDGGGIYLLGRMDGMLVENNYISRVNNDFGAIYLDNGCQGFTVTNNVIDRAHRNYIYKGDHHKIYDNYCQKSLVEPDLPMPELCDHSNPDILFENNYMWDDAEVEKIRQMSGTRK